MDNQQIINELEAMTPLERKMLKAHLLGYTKQLPPTIDEFLDSPYYMGKTWGKSIYPFWRKFLRELFPDEITTSNNIVVLSTCLGAGKTMLSIVIAAYNFCRLMFLQDLSYSAIADDGKPIVFLFNHTSADKAYQECIDPLRDAMKKSIFFSTKSYPFPKKYEIVGDSLRSNKAVGTNLLCASFSEVNFVNASKMKMRMNTIINRYTNRFMNFNGYLGNIILDSSPTGTDSLVESFLKKTPFNVKIVRAAIWEVKYFTGAYSDETFQVYAGDMSHKPFIVEGDAKLPDAYDPDRVINVPVNLYKNYKTDIVLALQDTAGLSISFTGTFIPNVDKVRSAFSKHYNYPKKIIVDQFDLEEKIQDYYEDYIRDVLPTDRRIFLHLDLGITGDFAGLSAGFYSGMYIDNDRDLNIKKPQIDVPFSIVISRRKGQETSIDKITEFIIWLSTIYEIYVSMDTYQTRVIYQRLELNKIKVCMLSVDRNVDPYNFLKLEIYEGLISGPKDEHLITELTHLKMIKNKVDHDSSNSKDQSDSVCGVAYNILKNLKWAAKMPKRLQAIVAAKVLNSKYGPSEQEKALNTRIQSLMRYEEDDEDEI